MTAFMTYKIEGKNVQCHFGMELHSFLQSLQYNKVVLLVDENLSKLTSFEKLGAAIIVVPSGENNKIQCTADLIISQLIQMQINKDDLIIGVGGGVVTDITGYVASIYKRGIRFGLVPTTILAMVDAAIGGKNGVNVGLYKNMVGTIYQPDFILYDFSFLQTLDHSEWVNGFAEIIKHACIADADLFELLCEHDLKNFKENVLLLTELIQKNVRIKFEIVQTDPQEKGNRKLLNFGHTFGHAIENLLALSHGQAVSIGMVIATKLSEKYCNVPSSTTRQLMELLNKYELPVSVETNTDQLFEMLVADKKRTANNIQFVLLDKIGSSLIHQVPLSTLQMEIKNLLA